MGGHEHHREGHKSTRSGAWEGFDKLKQALEGLATTKGISQSRIGAVAKLAAQYAKFYKHVVHDIEIFLWKAEVEHRLAGLYAIDAIIRHSHASNDPKEAYVKRFFVRMSDTIAAVKKVPDQFQPKVQHVIEEWQKRGIYTFKQIEDAGGREYLSHGQREQSDNVTPRASPGKLASLLSIIKQKKEENEQASEHHERPQIDGSLDKGRLNKDEFKGFNHQSYNEQRVDDKRNVGIMGDAPSLPIGSSRMQRDINDRPDSFHDRDLKKARGSRWGPPKLDNVPSERPTPIVTSSERDGNYRHDSSSAYGFPSGPSHQPSLLHSPRGAPSRHEEWNRNPPSSLGTGSGWPRDPVLSSQPGGVIRQNVGPYEQGGNPRSPFPGPDDRRSPGHRVPGTSGEVCRNFLAGRCPFGDRCWHIHDPQAASSSASRSEFAESKHKTVLCNNYPLGTCRFGDKCSFAHGKEELDKSNRYPPRPAAPTEALSGGRWQPSPGLRQGMEQSHVLPYVNVPASSSQARSYGISQVYNELHGDRGSLGGDSSISYANAAAPSSHQLPQGALTAPPLAYQGPYPSVPTSAAANNMTFSTQGAFYSNRDQNQTRVPTNVPVIPSPAPISNAKVLADDDEVETAEPEFTLEYDEDD